MAVVRDNRLPENAAYPFIWSGKYERRTHPNSRTFNTGNYNELNIGFAPSYTAIGSYSNVFGVSALHKIYVQIIFIDE